MKISILITAVLPILGFIWWIYIKDKYEKEPPIKLFKYFILGVVGSFFAIGLEKFLITFNLYNGIISNLFVAFVVVGLSEEGIKYILLIPTLLKEKDFNEKLDGIVYSVCLSLGIAAIENAIYLMSERYEDYFELGITRGIISIPAHIMFAITMGYYISKYKFDNDKKNIYLVKAIIIPVLLHGFFDFILMIGSRWAIIIFIVYVIFL